MQEDFYFGKEKIYIKIVNINKAGQLSILLSNWEKKI